MRPLKGPCQGIPKSNHTENPAGESSPLTSSPFHHELSHDMLPLPWVQFCSLGSHRVNSIFLQDMPTNTWRQSSFVLSFCRQNTLSLFNYFYLALFLNPSTCSGHTLVSPWHPWYVWPWELKTENKSTVVKCIGLDPSPITYCDSVSSTAPDNLSYENYVSQFMKNS